MKLPSLKQSIYLLWKNLTKHRRRQFFLVILLMFVGAFANVVSLGAVFPFISILATPEKFFSMPIIQDIVAFVGITQAGQLVLPLTLTFICLALLASAFQLLVLWVNTRFAYAAGHDLSTVLYQTTLHQPYHVHASRNSSSVITGVTKVDNAITILAQLLTMANAVLVSLAILGTLMAINPLITSQVLLGFGFCYALIAWFIRRRLYKNSKCEALEMTQRMKILQEGLGGIRDVLLSGSQKFYVDIYRRSDWSLRHAQGRSAFIIGSPRFLVEALGMVLIAILTYGLSLMAGGLGSVLPLMGALALGIQRLLPTLQQIYGAWAAIASNQVHLHDAMALIEQPMSEEALLPPPAPLDFKSEIQFEKVSFRYNQNGPWVVQDLNLRIAKGARVGFVGSTGCGKSTNLDLLMGILRPTSGRILVDGLSLHGERMRAWQRIIGHVPQSIFLADTTMAENIAFGEPSETIDMERVRRAARQSQIAKFIESTPKGYNTFVGERGICLSGGQRQRLGIARALYKKAEVLVFDEATSALDNDTEREVMDAIRILGRELTILIIAHRLSTVSHCDMIAQLDKGKMKVSGTYENTLSECKL